MDGPTSLESHVLKFVILPNLYARCSAHLAAGLWVLHYQLVSVQSMRLQLSNPGTSALSMPLRKLTTVGIYKLVYQRAVGFQCMFEEGRSILLNTRVPISRTHMLKFHLICAIMHSCCCLFQVTVSTQVSWTLPHLATPHACGSRQDGP